MSIQRNEKWVLDLREDIFLRFDVLHLFQPDDVELLHDLECADLPTRVILLTDLLHPTECASSKRSVNLKLIEGEHIEPPLPTGLLLNTLLILRGVLIHTLHL